ncbi:MAG: apolipoprotein N-acyltransferase [Acidimicrobiia bacterium]|nr:apolipoprotein N-acyltransferase [Acidimicrobiia bacterium]
MISADRARVSAAAVASGGLVALSMPPWGFWPLAFVGLAGLDRLIAVADARARFRRASLFGLAWIMPATLWMWALTAPGYLVVGPLFAAALGAAAMAVPANSRRPVALVGVIVVWEVARWSFPFGGVPLATLAMSQVNSPLAPTVRLLGPLLLVALTVAVGIGASLAVDRRWVATAIASGLVVGFVALAAVAPDGTAVGEIDVALVQGGGPQGTRAINTSAEEVYQRHLAATELVEAPVDLVVWPENVIDIDRRLEETPKFAELQALAVRLDAHLVVGVTEDVSDDAFVNSSVLISPAGVSVDRYEKVIRVPFGEYVPFRAVIEPFAPDYLPARDARAGDTDAVLDSDIGVFGVSISWEIFFDTSVRAAVRDGAQVVLNPTNGSSYWLTIVQTQQVASSQLRALETGRYVLQAAPTGFTAIITPDGDVIDRTGVSERAVVQGTIELRDGETLAVRLGRWPMVLAAVALIGLAWAPSQRRRATEATPSR